MSLSGLRVLVTRGREQAAELAELLRARGAVPVLFPTVRIVAAGGEELDRVSRDLSSFGWLLLASANAARHFLPAALAAGPLPESLRVATVGPGTSRAARELGVAVHLEAPHHTAEGLVEALLGKSVPGPVGKSSAGPPAEGVSGVRFLLPRAAEGREVLPGELARLGGEVVVVTAYRNEQEPRDDEAVRALLADPPDVVTFASPSSIRHFLSIAGKPEATALLSRSVVAVIGEVTARAAAKLPARALVVPSVYTLDGMVEALEAHYSKEGAAP